MFNLFVFIMLIWSFFQPSIASYVYISFLLLFEGWLFLTYLFAKPKLLNESDKWSAEELAALTKYHLAFRFPSAIRIIASFFPPVFLTTFIWVPWLLYKHIWIPAIFIGLNCLFLITYFQIRCSDPRPYLEKVVNAGNLKHYDELEAIKSIYEKLFDTEKNSADNIDD